jgi:hypothetical protein
LLLLIAEDLERQAEDLAEEGRDRVVTAVATGEYATDPVALVVGVRPVLDATTTVEEGVVEAIPPPMITSSKSFTAHRSSAWLREARVIFL